MSSNLLPMKFSVYKGVGGKFGVAQFTLQKSHIFCKACKAKFFGEETTQEMNKTRGRGMICPSCQASDVLSTREGAIFLETASVIPGRKNEYNWEETKVMVALSVNDLAQLLAGFRTGNEVSIFHDPSARGRDAGKVTKKLSVSFPKGTKEGGMLRLTQTKKKDDGNSEVQTNIIPLSRPDIEALICLFQKVIPTALSW